MKSPTSHSKGTGRLYPPSDDVVENLFNLLDRPALILDTKSSNILATNRAFRVLTGHRKEEINGAPMFEVIEMDSLFPMEEASDIAVRLVRKDQMILNAKLDIKSLDKSSKKLLLTFTTLSIKKNSGVVDVVRALRGFSKIVEESSIEKGMSQIIEVVKNLLDVDIVLIYNAEDETPRLKKIAAHDPDHLFPEYLASTELVRLSQPAIKRPGDRILSELFHGTKEKQVQFLASVPLGQERALFGILAVGDTKNPPSDEILDILGLLGDQVTLVMQYFILVNNLERQINQQKQLLLIRNALVENDHNGILVLGDDLKIKEINASAEWILGYTSKEVVGQPAGNILIGPESLNQLLASALAGIPTHNLGNIILHRRDGSPFPGHMQLIPVMKGNSASAIMVFISDISEKEQIRERTQQLEHRAVLGEVIAIFAHEVRNPINNISTGLQLLASKLHASDPNQDLISRMMADCQRLNHLMESVLAFSRPIEPQFEDLDISELLKRVLDRWRPRMARENVTPFFQMEKNPPKVVGDPRSLEQVFINLISNAINAMGKNNGGTLAIKVAPDHSISNHPQVVISISDSGPGIPEEIRARLFDPFVTTSRTGTGLGLAITKRIVTAHHGNIKVESFPGGTIFHVYLPMVRENINES